VAALAESLDGKDAFLSSCGECGLIGRRHIEFRSRTLARPPFGGVCRSWPSVVPDIVIQRDRQMPQCTLPESQSRN
jgi:hypothetical protein